MTSNPKMARYADSDKMMPNPFEKCKKVKEYLLDTYPTDFVLWIKDLMGDGDFRDFGETPITEGYKKSLDIKLTEMHTLHQQTKIIGTARDLFAGLAGTFSGRGKR